MRSKHVVKRLPNDNDFDVSVICLTCDTMKPGGHNFCGRCGAQLYKGEKYMVVTRQDGKKFTEYDPKSKKMFYVHYEKDLRSAKLAVCRFAEMQIYAKAYPVSKILGLRGAQ